MNDFRMESGNGFADAILERRLASTPEYWALVDFLSESGVLDREKFKEFLLRHLEEYVDIVTQTRDARDD
ncbi:hypothetical protein I310019A7_24460 [Lawsonibacter asaccharolyticus]